MLSRAVIAIAVGLGLLALFEVHARRTYIHDYTGGGDSPHYLMMARSLARDGDLKLTPAERSIDGFYEDFPLELDTRIISEERPYNRHPVGAPVLFSLGYMLGQRQGVLCEIAFIATLTAIVLWMYLLEITGDGLASGLAMLAVALAVPFVPLAANEYTEMPALYAQVFALAMLAGVRRTPGDRLRLLLAGVAIGALPWIHARYLPVAAALFVAGWIRAEAGLGSRAWMVLPAAGMIAGLYAWGVHVTGAFSLTLPFSLSAGNSVLGLSPLNALQKGFWGHLCDQQGGLLAYAPHLALAVLGAGEVWHRWRGEALVHLGYGVPTVLVVSMYPNWSGHWGVPCRFLAVLLPGIALALVPVMRRAVDRGARGVLAVAPPATWSLLIAGAMVRWPPLQLSLEHDGVNLGAPFVYLYRQTGIELVSALPGFIYTPHLRDYLLALAMLSVTASGLRLAARLLEKVRPADLPFKTGVFALALACWAMVTWLTKAPDPLAEDPRWPQQNVEHLLSYPLYYELLAERAMALHRPDVARRCVERVMEVKPDWPPAFAQMTAVMKVLRPAEVRPWAERGLACVEREDVVVPERLFWRGYLELVLGRGEAARADLSEYLKRPGTQEPVARRLLAQLDSVPGIGR